MKIEIRGVLGEIPRLEPHRLPLLNASIARNVKNFRGNAEPFKAPNSVTTLAKAGEKKAIYRFGQELDSDTQYWFHWLNDCDVARGPTTGNDTEERTYYAEAGQPMRMTDATMATGGASMPVSSYLVGLPAPGVAPTVALTDPSFTFNTTTDVNETDDVITEVGHGFSTGTSVTYTKEGGTAAIGLTDGNLYYVRAVSADTLSFHATVADAEANANKIALTSIGDEPHKITRGVPPDVVSTQLLVGYTYVNSWGQEGPMSAVSTTANFYPGQTLAVSSLEAGPIGAYNVTLKRIYVAQTDADSRTVLRFWKEIAVAAASTSGLLDLTTLGAAAQDPEPIAPPSGLISLRAHPNQFFVGLDVARKRFCRSEAYKVYAWPDEYQDPLDAVPVACEVIGSSVVIGTKGPTYLATGNDPLRLIPVRLEGQQPCVAKRSMRLTNAGVIYSSPDGLVAVTPDGRMTLVTREVFTRDQWQAYKPESMHAIVHDERYFCWWQVAADNRGLMIFDFTGEGLGVIHSDQWASAAYSDPRRDALFLATPASGDNLVQWDAGIGYLSMKWRSKRFTSDREHNLGAAQLKGDYSGGRSVTFRVYADDHQGDGMMLRDTVIVTSSAPFQLDRSYKANDYELEVEGNAVVREIIAAGTMAQLAT
jgi:hypothetical protein